MEQLMAKITDAVVASAEDGLTQSEACAAVLQLGLKMTASFLGKDATVGLIRRYADGLAGPTPMNVVDLFNAKPEGSA